MVCAGCTDVGLLEQAWTLSPSVALRREALGALAYHFGTRKLTFLKTPELAAVVQSLGEHPSARAAMSTAGVPAVQHEACARALEGLASLDVIRPRSVRHQETDA